VSEHLDVFVAFPPIDLVLDAVVGEVDLTVEVRQVVLPGPLPDLLFAAARSTVALGLVAVVFNQ